MAQNLVEPSKPCYFVTGIIWFLLLDGKILRLVWYYFILHKLSRLLKSCLLFWCWPTTGNMVNKTSSQHNTKYKNEVTFPCLEKVLRKSFVPPHSYPLSPISPSLPSFSSSSPNCRAPWQPPPLPPPPACTRPSSSSGTQVWKVTYWCRHLHIAALRLDLEMSAQFGTGILHSGQDGEFADACIKHCPPSFSSGHSHALSVCYTGSEKSPHGTRPRCSPPCRWYTCRSTPGLPWSPSCRRVS